MLFKMSVIKNFASFTAKHQIYYKRLQHRCFPEKFGKILRATFLLNTSGSCFRENIFHFFMVLTFVLFLLLQSES